MDPKDLFLRLKEVYGVYNDVIKPLIADIEVREQRFPGPLLNEIRALNDHIAQCFREDAADQRIIKEVVKAKSHTKRIVFDCYKYLDASIFNKIGNFEEQTRRIDLTAINNGKFYPEYLKLKKSAENALRKAKIFESQDREISLEKFQEAYNIYCDLDNLVIQNMDHVKWARRKYKRNSALKFLAWLVAAIISGFIGVLVTCSFLGLSNFGNCP